jgi:hypothetical protein
MELAKRGALARLADLRHELDMLLEFFPHLRDGVDRDELPVSFLLKQGAEKRQKRALSAAGRRAISRAQKARWAAHRKAQSK